MHAELGELRPTTVQLRESEHAALAAIARVRGNSKAGVVRRLIQEEARKLGLWEVKSDDQES
jgi:hypothetical protein